MHHYQLTDDLTDSQRAELAAEVAGRLSAGEVGIVPTETVPGLMCLYHDAAAKERIFRMKSRDARKPLQVLLADFGQIRELGVDLSKSLMRLAPFWPGALTVVTPDQEWTEHGIRIPDHQWVRAMLAAVGQPVAATSANLSGSSPAESQANGYQDLAEQPDFIVSASIPVSQPSTVVSLRLDQLTLLREGAIPFAMLEKALERGCR